jgi:hypothetical protein
MAGSRSVIVGEGREKGETLGQDGTALPFPRRSDFDARF